MKLIFILTTVLFITACTQSVEVPKDKYGLLLRLGKIESTISGPAKLEKLIITESVMLIDKIYIINLNKGQYTIKYEVKDPELYFKIVHGNSSILDILEKKLANHAIKGETVTSKEHLHKIIESMKLPIILDKNA